MIHLSFYLTNYLGIRNIGSISHSATQYLLLLWQSWLDSIWSCSHCSIKMGSGPTAISYHLAIGIVFCWTNQINSGSHQGHPEEMLSQNCSDHDHDHYDVSPLQVTRHIYIWMWSWLPSRAWVLCLQDLWAFKWWLQFPSRWSTYHIYTSTLSTLNISFLICSSYLKYLTHSLGKPPMLPPTILSHCE